MSERETRARARRYSAVLHRTRLGAEERDRHPVQGVEAISLLTRLSLESWSWSGRQRPTYERRDIPCRFVPFAR